MSACLFCSIVSGEIPADIVRRNDRVVAFRDIDPQAPAHILVVPARHYDNIDQLTQDSPALAGEVMATAASIAAAEGLEDGYRLVVNTGSNGGQTVDHLHVHVLGGRQLTWPPG